MSEYDKFKEEINRDRDRYIKFYEENELRSYFSQIDELMKLQNHLSLRVCVKLFDEQLGTHLFEKFVENSDRNILHFLNSLDSEYKCFLLLQLKTNQLLFV